MLKLTTACECIVRTVLTYKLWVP